MPDTDTKSTDIAKLGRALANFDDTKVDYYLREAVVHLRHAVQLIPMSKVLDCVPGSDSIRKAEAARVSRSTWYAWKRGEVRPNREQAARLEKLTQIPAEKFAGRR